MKEWKLQKSKVCLLNLSIATSNLKNFEPRFLFQVYGVERLAIISIFWAIFFKFTQLKKIQYFPILFVVIVWKFALKNNVIPKIC
jgi:hypothetical protein